MASMPTRDDSEAIYVAIPNPATALRWRPVLVALCVTGVCLMLASPLGPLETWTALEVESVNEAADRLWYGPISFDAAPDAALNDEPIAVRGPVPGPGPGIFSFAMEVTSLFFSM